MSDRPRHLHLPPDVVEQVIEQAVQDEASAQSRYDNLLPHKQYVEAHLPPRRRPKLVEVINWRNILLMEQVIREAEGEPPLDGEPLDERSRILGTIALKRETIARLEEEIADLVSDARQLDPPVSWADIGQSAGVTGQTAYRKWDEHGREVHTEYNRKRPSVRKKA